MFDSTAKAAAELLSYFGKNTAVRIDHKYGHPVMSISSARTGNVIATVSINSNGVYAVDNLSAIDLADVAQYIMSQKNFPRPRNMKRSWSPIRLSVKAQEMMDADSGIRFA
jgi:hypothetical protein